MRRLTLLSRLACWAAICTLVLRAGVPLLATAAAQIQGVPVGEVCEVYGVSLPAMTVQAVHEHAHEHVHDHVHGHHPTQAAPQAPHTPHHADADHGCDHCALTALGALATPGGADALAAPPSTATLAVLAIPARCTFHDACAAWAAGHAHGPPARV